MQAASSPATQAYLKQCLTWHVVTMFVNNSPDGVMFNAMPSTNALVAVPLVAYACSYLLFQVRHHVCKGLRNLLTAVGCQHTSNIPFGSNS